MARISTKYTHIAGAITVKSHRFESYEDGISLQVIKAILGNRKNEETYETIVPVRLFVTVKE